MSRQEPGLCHECLKPLGDEDLKYRGGYIFHKQCYKKALNKAEGRRFLCPSCNGSGLIFNDKKEEYTMRYSVTTTTCKICKGYGYTSVEFQKVEGMDNFVQKA